MIALTKELRQKVEDLKTFFKVYQDKHEKLDQEWHELFEAFSSDDEARAAYWDLTEDIQREL